jgi:hypothetical protein
MQTDFAVSRPICRVGLPAVRASSAKILLNTDHPAIINRRNSMASDWAAGLVVREQGAARN